MSESGMPNMSGGRAPRRLGKDTKARGLGFATCACPSGHAAQARVLRVLWQNDKSLSSCCTSSGAAVQLLVATCKGSTACVVAQRMLKGRRCNRATPAQCKFARCFKGVHSLQGGSNF
eukprot:350500-Chlamydomonas_euryale.AAC.21